MYHGQARILAQTHIYKVPLMLSTSTPVSTALQVLNVVALAVWHSLTSDTTTAVMIDDASDISIPVLQ